VFNRERVPTLRIETPSPKKKGRNSVIDRRRFVCIALVGSLTTPLVLVACTRERVYRIGVLMSGPPDGDAFEDFAAPLLELGWIEGKNLVVERRYGSYQPGRLDALAVELVELKPDLIISRGTTPTLAAKKATTTIPIVMSGASDPVATGIVPSLSRPGGNITGYAFMTPELIAKRAQVVHEMLPAAQRIAFVIPLAAIEAQKYSGSINAFLRDQALAVYRSLGMEMITVDFARPFGDKEAENAIAEAARSRVHAVDFYVGGSASAIEAANARRLPVIVRSREQLEAGGLMYLEVNLDDRPRRVAAIVDKILRGAKPADIAIEQPTKLTLGINVKAANALGISIPQAIVLRADEVIR
jgi:putative ABC transport system substrate-binding protein